MALRAPWGRMQGAATRVCPLRIAEGWPSGGRPERRFRAPVTASRTIEHALREKRNAADGPTPRRNLLVAGLLRAAASRETEPTQIALLGMALRAQAFARGRTRRLQSFFRTLLGAFRRREWDLVIAWGNSRQESSAARRPIASSRSSSSPDPRSRRHKSRSWASGLRCSGIRPNERRSPARRYWAEL
jgi:hypothetical protein